MSRQVLPPRRHQAGGAGPKTWALLALLASLSLAQAGCLLTGETVHYRYVYNRYACRATLVNTSTGERRVVESSMLARTAPGAPARDFFDYDWDGNGTRNEADVLLDWRRYLSARVLTSGDFAGGSWCVMPSDISCTRGGTVSFASSTHTPLPAGAPTECPVDAGARLEVSAPGLTPGGQLSFPDTPVGGASAPVTFTVTNPSTVPVRVNGVGFLPGGGADAPDFVKSDSCLPTAADMGRGHLLAPGGTCSFQMQFRPQHRDGVAECAAAAPDESCRRVATVSVTGESDLERNNLAPANVALSGRAIGGSLVVEPASEVCFSRRVDCIGCCTETRVIRISNGGPGELTINSVGLTGDSAANGFQFLAPYPMLPGRLRLGGLPVDLNVRYCNPGSGSGADGAFTINSSDRRLPTTAVTLVNPQRLRCP